MPIGRPLDNVRAWVLDRSNAAAPPGVPGELHAGAWHDVGTAERLAELEARLAATGERT